MRRLALAPLAALTLLLPLGAQSTGTAAPAYPELRVQQVVTGLNNPWDVQELPNGNLLIDESDSDRILVAEDGVTRTVAGASKLTKNWDSGETGLMGMALDRRFAENGRFYLCRGVDYGSGHRVRVEAWTLNGEQTSADLVDVLVGGIKTTTGRHGGCRLLMGSGGYLYVGTGDAALYRTPQDTTSLNGKVLRIYPSNGNPVTRNPWYDSKNRIKRYVYNYGHRNVQGLAERADGTMWSVEHGSYRDDEVNLLRSGANYGWNPGPGYDESRPMTDYGLPGKQEGAKWRSGNPTIAPSGASWVKGSQWGAYDGMLAVGVLKEEQLRFLRFSASGTLQESRIAPELHPEFGRLRSVTRASDGALLVTTSNQDGQDKVLRVTPVS